MLSEKKRREITRREFLGRGAAGVTALGFSSALLNALLLHTGCSPGAKTGGLILPEERILFSVFSILA